MCFTCIRNDLDNRYRPQAYAHLEPLVYIMPKVIQNLFPKPPGPEVKILERYTEKTYNELTQECDPDVRNLTHLFVTDPDLFEEDVQTVGNAFRFRARYWKRTLSYHEYCRRLCVDAKFLAFESSNCLVDVSTWLVMARAHMILSYVNCKRIPRLSLARANIMQSEHHQPPSPIPGSSPRADILKCGFAPQSGGGEREFSPQIAMPWNGFSVGLNPETLGAVEELKASVDDISNRLANGVDVKHTVPQLSAASDLLDDLCTKFGPFAKISMFIASLAICWHFIVDDNRSTTLGVGVGVFSMLIALKFGAEYVREYFDPVVTMFNEYVMKKEREASGLEPEFAPQISTSNIATLLSSLVLGECLGRSWKMGYEWGGLNCFLRTLTMLPKIEDGIVMLVETVISFVQTLINWVRSKAGYSAISLVTSPYPELLSLEQELEIIVSDLRSGGSYNYENGTRVFELMRRSEKLFHSIPNSSDAAAYKRAAGVLVNSLKPLVQRMERNNIVGNGPRREPLAIMLGGPTGVGKSTIVPLLINATSMLVLPEQRLKSFEENHNDDIWVYNRQNPFADSYHGQFNTFVDEVAAFWDQAGVPDSEVEALLRMINTANYPLHMANLEDKGNVNFRSELVWGTTNRRAFQFKSMVYPKAFTRRWRFSYVMVPKVEYCKPKEGVDLANFPWEREFDETKAKAADFDMDVPEFIPWDYNDGKPSGEPTIGFMELVIKLADAFKKHSAKSDLMMTQHCTIKDTFLRLRAQREGPAVSDELRELVEADFEPDKETFGAHVSGWLHKNVLAPFAQATQGVIDDRINWPKLGVVCSILGMAGMMWKFAGPRIFPQSGDVRPNSKKSSRPKLVRHLRERAVVVDSAGVAQHGTVSQNVQDITSKIFKKNLYKVTCEDREMGYVLFLYGRVAVMPEHYVYTVEDWVERGMVKPNPTLSFAKCGAPATGFEVKLDQCDFRCHEDDKDDITYVVFPAVTCNHPDITNFVMEDGDKFTAQKFDSALLRPDGSNYALVTTLSYPIGVQEYAGYSISNGMTYSIATRKGECGSPLFALHTNKMPYLVGIHVSGNGALGTSTRLSKSAIDSVKETFPPSVLDRISSAPNFDSQISDKLVVTHKVPALRIPTQSKIVPSLLHEAWGTSDYMPAFLKATVSQGVKIDPWALARTKYSNVSRALNLTVLDMISEDTISTMMYTSTMGDPWDPRVLTFEEAVAGVDGVDFVDGIPRDTSPGYPFVLDSSKPGKRDWFGSDGPYDFSGPKCRALKKSIRELENRLGSGERGDFLFADFLKDARELKTKALLGKTRLISAGAMDLLILTKMYFGDLVRWTMQNRIKNGFCIGVNPYSHEWTTLAQHLLSVGKNLIFGDFSGFDGTLPASIMYKFLKLSAAFYHSSSERDNNIRTAIFEEFVNSRHVAYLDNENSVVYEWNGSNPSGNGLTTPLNTFCNLVIIKYASCVCYAQSLGYTIFDLPLDRASFFVRGLAGNLRIIAFGDDVGVSVSDEWTEWVDQEKMTRAMATFGFKFTNEAKDGTVHKFRPLSECTFLKRGFSLNKHRYDAPLDMNVILEAPYWTKKGAPPGTSESIVETSLMELAFHGRDLFAEWAPILARASVARLSHRPNISFEYCYDKAIHCENEY